MDLLDIVFFHTMLAVFQRRESCVLFGSILVVLGNGCVVRVVLAQLTPDDLEAG